MRALFGLILLLTGFSISAQDATISGTVRDESGAVMPGVSVSVRGPKPVGSTTDDKGRYELRIPPEDLEDQTVTVRFAFLRELVVQSGLVVAMGFGLIVLGTWRRRPVARQPMGTLGPP